MILKKIELDPETIPPEAHFAAWTGTSSETVPAQALSLVGDNWRLLGPFKAFRLVEAFVCFAYLSAFDYLRPASVNPESGPLLALAFARSGEATFYYGDNEPVKLSQDQALIADATVPLRVVAQTPIEFVTIYLYAPAMLVHTRLSEHCHALAVPLRGGITAALSGLISQLEVALDEYDEFVVNTLVKTIEVMLDKLAQPVFHNAHCADRDKMLAIQDFVDENIRHPLLGVDMLCDRFHMSRATLYRQMQVVGGVKCYLQSRRLVHCFAELRRCHQMADGYQRAIVRSFHFKSVTDFCQRYEGQFGTNPVLFIDPEQSRLLSAQGRPNAHELFNWQVDASVG